MIPSLQLGGAGRILVPSAGGGGGEDPHFASVVSLLHFDGPDESTTFTDQKGLTWTPAGNAQIDTAQSKFGGASGLFDGSGDYLTTPDNAGFTFGTGDFCIEFWLRTLQASAYLVDRRVGSFTTGSWSLFMSGGAVQWYAAAFHPSAPVVASGAVNNGAWRHVAVTRGSGTTRIFVDGVQAASNAAAYDLVEINQQTRIGAQSQSAALSYSGHMDDFRVTKGVARYTADFTPPAAPFPDS